MDAGREMDALVAEKVMGLPVVWSEEPYQIAGKPRKEGRQPYLKGRADGVEYDWAEVKRFSTDIAAAWLVVERMYENGYNVGVSTLHDWRLRNECSIYLPGTDGDGVAQVSADADTPALAICRAALKVVAS